MCLATINISIFSIYALVGDLAAANVPIPIIVMRIEAVRRLTST